MRFLSQLSVIKAINKMEPIARLIELDSRFFFIGVDFGLTSTLRADIGIVHGTFRGCAAL